MSYSKITSFAVKDTLADNDPLKVVRGKEFDDEFDAIAVAMAVNDTTIGALVTTPTGSILMHAVATPPTGFLICDGSAKSRLTYAALFAVIGVSFGIGDGVNTFNLPNLVNRFPLGTTPGSTGGSADAVVVSHSHSASTTIYDPGHTHPVDFSSGNDLFMQFSGQVKAGGTSGVGYTNISAATTVNGTGVSGVGANMPPFIGLAFIIKT